MKVIDSHYLVGTDYWLSQNIPERPHKEYLEELTRLTNSNIDCKALVYPFPSSEDGKYKKENEELYQLCKNNKRVIPVFALNINYEECFYDVEKYLKLFPKAGIVIWPILCNIDVNKISINNMFKNFSERNEFFIYIHVAAMNEKDIGRVKNVGNYGPQEAIDFAKSFSNKKIILGHLLRCSKKCLKEAKNLSNVMIETSGVSGHKRWFENEQNVFPAYDAEEYLNYEPDKILEDLIYNGYEDKLIFGSSYPFSYWWKYNLEDEINLVNNLKIDEKVKEKILYKNIKKFLELGEW